MPLVAVMVCPCLATVALPLTFLTIATEAEAVATEISPPMDRRKKKTTKERTNILEQVRFILDTLQRFLFFHMSLRQELSQKADLKI